MTDYTPNLADVDLVADALARAYCWDGLAGVSAVAPTHAESFRRDAEVVMTALAGAGRLVPPDADSRTEYNIRTRYGNGQWKVVEDLAGSEPERDWPWVHRHFGADAHQVIRTVRTFADGSQWVGPWLPVPTTPEAS